MTDHSPPQEGQDQEQDKDKKSNPSSNDSSPTVSTPSSYSIEGVPFSPRKTSILSSLLKFLRHPTSHPSPSPHLDDNPVIQFTPSQLKVLEAVVEFENKWIAKWEEGTEKYLESVVAWVALQKELEEGDVKVRGEKEERKIWAGILDEGRGDEEIERVVWGMGFEGVDGAFVEGGVQALREGVGN